MSEHVMYPVTLPNGQVWHYPTKTKAENAAVICRALAAMPVLRGRATSLALYGQQAALARALGHVFGPGTRRAGKPNHMRVYCLLRDGGVPRDAGVRARLLELGVEGVDHD